MKISELLNELHHTESPTYQPFKHGDTITVYHGFNVLNDAILAVHYGLSGAERVPRVYSYEGDNNPKGLFVTMSLQAASYFTGAGGAQVVMQFDANLAELEAPVWPGGSWTGQGQKSQYFGHGAPGRVRRHQKRSEEESEYKHDESLPHWVKLSDNPHLVSKLTTGGEPQALFVGHLNPNRITALHVKDIGKNRVAGPMYTLTREQFLEKFKPATSEKTYEKQAKVFQPDEIFNPEVFKTKLAARHNIADIDATLARMWKNIRNSPSAAFEFNQSLGKYLWPKQIPTAFNWMKRTYKIKENNND